MPEVLKFIELVTVYVVAYDEFFGVNCSRNTLIFIRSCRLWHTVVNIDFSVVIFNSECVDGREEFFSCTAENNSAETGLKSVAEITVISVEIYGQLVRRKITENLKRMYAENAERRFGVDV